MMIMPSNNGSCIVHYFAGRYPGKIGLLYSPDGCRKPPFYMPYACDNGCFKKWDSVAFFTMLQRIKLVAHPPLWVVVPDKVGDAEVTLRRWHRYNKLIEYPLAFACQDGMEPQDVPSKAFACFIGGTTSWKLENAHKFKGVREWLHIGRVSTEKRMRWAKGIGADSIDGTGFFRGRGKQYNAFVEYFEKNKY